MTRQTLCILGAAVLITASVALSAPPDTMPGAKPNIVFILIDDLGKEWVSCYGAQDIQTPRIDELAATGMRFENAWCMPQCTPSRVTLLTGTYPFRHGWTNHWDVPRWGSGGHFDVKLNTSMGKVMRDAGYVTCAAGKWQIDDFRVEPDAMRDAGFDESCMWTGGEGGNEKVSDERYWDPYIHVNDQPSRTFKGRFGPDVFSDFVVDFMKRHRDQPMFIYYPMVLTHTPLTTTPDEPDAKGKMDQHKAMVRYADKMIGKVVDALDELKLRQNTIVIVTTDNGTTGAITGRRLDRAVRGAKMQMVEAGTAIPFVVNCPAPGKVPAGVVTKALVDFTDLLPTFAELGGAKLPTEHEIDGQSFAPLILGKKADSPRGWILSMGGHPAAFRDGRVTPAQAYDDRVVRDGRWKLWIGTDREPVKLFDMQADPWETNNELGSYDEAARAARQRLLGLVRSLPETDAIPQYTPNPPQKWDKYKLQP